MLISRPRLLVVRIQSKAPSFIVVSAHAPHKGPVREWLRDVEYKLTSLAPSVPILLFMDANLEAVDQHTPISGDLGLGTPASNADVF